MTQPHSILSGDVVEVLESMDGDSVDAVLCDPPYGIGFMGKEFDTFKPEVVRQQMKRDTRTQKRRQLYGGRESDAPSAAMAAARYDLSLSGNQTFQAWCTEWATAILRVLKPGGMMLAFGGTRTFHRLTCAIEDAGFEIRDCLMWIYGSGFPKSLDISKAIDKAAGVERKQVRHYNPRNPKSIQGGEGIEGGDRPYLIEAREKGYHDMDGPIPATPAAKQWDGYGTALKPAWEPVVVAMKPLDGTFAQNALAHGVAGINVDGSRIPSGTEHFRGTVGGMTAGGMTAGDTRTGKALGRFEPGRAFQATDHPGGRWPANLILSHHPECVQVGVKRVKGSNFEGAETGRTNTVFGKDHRPREAAGYADADGLETVERWECVDSCPVKMLDGQSGDLSDNKRRDFIQPRETTGDGPATFLRGYGHVPFHYKDSGCASRFFYTAKSSRRERNAGCEGLETTYLATMGDGIGKREHNPDEPAAWVGNNHPTVKPLALCKYLATLILPPKRIAAEALIGVECSSTNRKDGDSQLRGLGPLRRILIPFCGSGSEMIGAMLAGWDEVVGIEKEAEYITIANARLKFWQTAVDKFGVPLEPDTVLVDAAPKSVGTKPSDGQMEMF